MSIGTPDVDVGVVVVTYNSERFVGDLVDSLEAGIQRHSWRLVVADNASSDGTVAALRERGFEVVEVGANLGYSAGINRGIARLPEARAILVVNPDVRIQPGAVAELVAALADPEVGITAPLTRDFDGRLSYTQRRSPSVLGILGTALLGSRLSSKIPALSEHVRDPRRYQQVVDVDWAVGSALLVSRECIDAVGPWDETFFLYSEETDYCERARRAGFAVRFVPSAVVLHEGGNGVENPRLRSMMTLNRVRYYRRHHGLVPSIAFYAAMVLNEAIRAVRGKPAARRSLGALLRPSTRPPELRASGALIPR